MVWQSSHQNGPQNGPQGPQNGPSNLRQRLGRCPPGRRLQDHQYCQGPKQRPPPVQKRQLHQNHRHSVPIALDRRQPLAFRIPTASSTIRAWTNVPWSIDAQCNGISWNPISNASRSTGRPASTAQRYRSGAHNSRRQYRRISIDKIRVYLRLKNNTDKHVRFRVPPPSLKTFTTRHDCPHHTPHSS